MNAFVEWRNGVRAVDLPALPAVKAEAFVSVANGYRRGQELLKETG